MINKITHQIKKIYVHIINLIQKTLLGDDFISIKIRNFLLRLIGVTIGKNVRILSGSDILGGNLTLCDGAFINKNCYLDLTGHLYIGENVGIGHGTTFITAEHVIGPPENRAGHIVKGLISPGPIRLEKGCWIAANVTILANITVGEGAVVVTNALVAKNVEANVMVAGAPARRVKSLNPDEESKAA